MWYMFLPKVLNMSLTASAVILFVLLARLVMKRAPKVFSYLLWAVVLFRLLCPVTLTSSVSLLDMMNVPVIQTSTYEFVPTNIVPTASTPMDILAPYINDGIHETLLKEEEQQTAAPFGALIRIATYLWLLGIAALLVYSAISLMKLRRKLISAIPLRDNIYLADYITSPFVIGFLRPKIYIPSSLSDSEQEYILLHEQHHIRRLDHVMKLFAFAALCLHWFNPLVWLSFILSGKDMEMSCDEAVIKKLGEGIRGDYSASLLSLATGRQMIGGTPLAFGEGDTKSRIKNVLNWKKHSRWITMIFLALTILVIVICAFNPKEETIQQLHFPVDTDSASNNDSTEEPTDISTEINTQQDPLDAAISTAILEFNKNRTPDGDFACESHVILATESSSLQNGGNADSVTVYAMVLYHMFDYSNSTFELVGGSHIPTALTFAVSKDGKYSLTEYWQPGDGSYYARDIREKFPKAIQTDALDTQKFILAQIQNCYAQVIAHGKVNTDRTIEQLFQTIASSPAESSNPSDYIDAHPIEYRELTYYGDYSLNYIFSAFLKGGQTDLKGHLMQAVMKALLGDEAISLSAKNGQEYFDAWKEAAVRKNKEHGLEYMKTNAPKAYLLLQLLK